MRTGFLIGLLDSISVVFGFIKRLRNPLSYIATFLNNHNIRLIKIFKKEVL